jgi:hypothetical protein
MKIYIDEDMASGLLVLLLQKAGHDAEVPAAIAMLGRSDVAQLTFAIEDGRVSLTANYDDYDELDRLVEKSRGDHPGILVVRREKDPNRNLTPKGIVAAIRKLEAAGVPIANEYVVLNHWR